jgi:hypothetical protein
MMKNRKCVLLETTIQVHRLADDPDIRQQINNELEGKKIYTTSFVLREILRTIIKDLAYVHSAVTTVGIGNDGVVALKRLLYVLGRGESNYSTRAARREMLIIGAILDHYDDRDLSTAELHAFLEWTVAEWLEEFFKVHTENGNILRIEEDTFLTGLDESPDEVLGYIQAIVGIPAPLLFPSGAAEYLSRRSALVCKVLEKLCLAPSSNRDRRLLETLLWLRDESTGEFKFHDKLSPRTRRGWALGDLLIALEAPSGCEIYTTDGHYNFLCATLGRRVYNGFMSAGVKPFCSGEA